MTQPPANSRTWCWNICYGILHSVLPVQTVDLFRFRFIFVPIHDHLHWSLAVICNVDSTAHQGKRNAPFICILTR